MVDSLINKVEFVMGSVRGRRSYIVEVKDGLLDCSLQIMARYSSLQSPLCVTNACLI
jgi:hypothetical protein